MQRFLWLSVVADTVFGRLIAKATATNATTQIEGGDIYTDSSFVIVADVLVHRSEAKLAETTHTVDTSNNTSRLDNIGRY